MESPVSLEQKPSFFRKVFRKFSPQARNQVILQTQQEPIEAPPPTSQPETKIVEVETPQVPERQLNIAIDFTNTLKEKGAVITSSKMDSKDHVIGRSSMHGTNETISDDLIEKVRSQKEAPNGYLIGVGIGNVVRMLELYPEGQLPKAIILFDIDPEVVRKGKELIQQLKDEPDKPDEEQNPYYDPIWIHLNGIPVSDDERKRLDFVLKKLAKEGNVTIEFADFTDLKTIDALCELPDIKSHNNVIYLSNIADWIFRDADYSIEGERIKNLDTFSKPRPPTPIPNLDFLTILTPKEPRKNYYVDTTTSSLAYNLRIGTHVPQYDSEDFKSSYGKPRKPPQSPVKPRDQIE